MEIAREGQAPAGEVYEEPMLVEAGEFTEMTQGAGDDVNDRLSLLGDVNSDRRLKSDVVAVSWSQ
jgi:hypothetical protein